VDKEYYRIGTGGRTAVHQQLLAVVGSLLVLPKSRREAAANATMLHRYAALFARLRAMTPEELHQLTRRLAAAVEVRVSLGDLQTAVDGMTADSERRNLHLQRCSWLIRHGGSNRMILLLCCEVSPQEIRLMRQEMKLPAGKGRIPALPLEERLSVLDSWRQSADEADTFLRYKKLAQQYPQYSLGQLYCTVCCAGEEA
jgi:hypothetical protein